jgi:hypothetical protein
MGWLFRGRRVGVCQECHQTELDELRGIRKRETTDHHPTDRSRLVALEEHNVGGLIRTRIWRRSLGATLMALLLLLAMLVPAFFYFGNTGVIFVVVAGVVLASAGTPSTDGATSKARTIISWLLVAACCGTIAWTLAISSEWFEEDLHVIMFFWLVLPQLLWFGLRFFLDRLVPKDSSKIRLHTKQNKILVGVCLVGALAVATSSPHRLRVSIERRLLEQANREVIRKCASNDAPTPRFAHRNIYRWTCTGKDVSFEGGTWGKLFDRGGTWGFTKSQTKPTNTD